MFFLQATFAVCMTFSILLMACYLIQVVIQSYQHFIQTYLKEKYQMITTVKHKKKFKL